MKISDIIREVVETLRECEALTGVPVIQEDIGDIHTELDTEIARRSVCAVVGWNGFTPIIQGCTAPDATPVGTIGIVVRVFENPSRNRTSTFALTASDIAIAIANALNGAIADGMAAPLWLKSISKVISDGDEHAAVTCDVNFETKASLN